ncbi:MAG: hypothetical protein EZS28_007966 [Streblomastix strix]|uniref:Uncharacterized protein n=1 Tax=Streblomastix strix TaxID=222440 RepID=A0A5J4WR10_9EUKA|nr:MAG: hypothetical protein EZS28_007966 [Streblomastix strix]
MTTSTQQWGQVSDDMPWDDKSFGDQQGLMDIERSVPQSIDDIRQKMGYAYDLKLLKKPPTRKQIQSDLPVFNLLLDKRSRRVGQGASADVDEAMQQLGYLVASKLHRDISKVDRLIHPQSAADWLKEKKLDKKGRTLSSEDLNNDTSTPNDAVVRNSKGKLYSIAGYRTTAAKKRYQTMLYENQYPTKQDRKGTTMKAWFDANIRLIKYISPWNYFKKVVTQVLKSFGHKIQRVQDVVEDIHNKQRNAYTILPDVIWRDYFIKRMMPSFMKSEIANTYPWVDLAELYKSDPSKYKQINDAAKAYFDSLFEYIPSGRLIKEPTSIETEITQVVKNAILSGRDRQNNFLFNVSEITYPEFV